MSQVPLWKLRVVQVLNEQTTKKRKELVSMGEHYAFVMMTKKSYEELVGNPTQVSFIRFQNLKTANNPVPLSNLRMLRGVKMLSGKGFYVDKNMAEKLISMME